MNKKMLALYGLKWNPFAPDVPVEALHRGAHRPCPCSWTMRSGIGSP